MKLDEGAFAHLEALAGVAIDADTRATLDKHGEWVPLQPLLDALPLLGITLGDAPVLSCGAVNAQGTITGKTVVFRVGDREIKVPVESL